MAGEIIHNRQHDIDDTDDHNGVSGAVQGNLSRFNANGLPEDAGVLASNVKLHNFAAAAVPIETDDDSAGYSAGSMWWFPDDRKLFICFNPSTGSAVWKLIMSNGLISNKTGGPLNQMYVVRPDTPQGGFPTVSLANADAELTSRDTLGLILETIADNGKGFVVNNTNLYNCDGSGATFSESWAVGDMLYLSAATDGYITKTAPAAPNHLVIIGEVISNHATQGIIAVRIQNGFETYELHDVNETPADTTGQVMVWNQSNLYYLAQFLSDAYIQILQIGTPTYTDLQALHNLLNSAGLLSNGAIITDAGGGDVNLAASQCLVRISDADTGDLKSADIEAAAGQEITTDTIRYIGIEYNAGTPQYVIKTTDSWDGNTEFRIGSVVNEGGTLHILNNPQIVANAIKDILHRLFEAEPKQRAGRLGGLILDETGTRNITVSAGEIYDHANEFGVSSLDSSVTGGFDSYHNTTKQATAATQWDNLYYSLAGSRTEMTVGRYANLWFYVELDDSVVMVYGNGQYTSAALAQAEGVPATIPNRLQAHGKLIGRLIFLKSAATATLIESAFSTVFTGAGAAGHGDLTGLSSDDHTQYSLLSSQAGTPTSTPSRVGEINVDTTNDRVWQSAGTASAGDWVLVNNRFIVWRLLDQSTDHVVDTNIAGDLRLPLAYKIKNVWAYADTAGTGSVTTVDINEAGTTILSTKITIDATKDHSKDSAIPPVISDSAIAAWAKVTADIDGIASGTPGKGITLVFEIDFTG